MKWTHGSAVVAAGLLLGASACVRPTIRATVGAPGAVDIAQLWQDPVDLEQRDLFHGAGGAALVPDQSVPFAFVAADRSGYSTGYDVRDPSGLTWSVKLGPEAQSEVVASRLLWTIGFHQPPTYYVPAWTMTGERSGRQPAGRFRPELPGWEVVGEWSWYENPFAGTRPFKGLIVANLILNNWDWKTSNNKIYVVELAAGLPAERLYVVRDVGASLGQTSFPKLLDWFPTRGFGQGSRNNLEDFEEQGFIKRVDGDRVKFFYRGIHQSLLDTVARDDVVWTCRLLSRLGDAQWHDAFRAAGYADDRTRRFVANIKSKVAEGLRLAQI